MTEPRIIEIEADTLDEAREQIKSQIPEGLHLLSEQVISDGKPKTVNATADTTEAAFAKAQSEIPTGAEIINRKELSAPERKTITIEAPSEESATLQGKVHQVGRTAIVTSVKLLTSGNKGFLGLGKKT